MAFAFCAIWFCSTGFGQTENEDRTILNFLRPLQMSHDEPPPGELQTSKAWDAVILDASIVAGYKHSKSISRKNTQFDAILSEYQTENLKVITKQTVGVWAAEISIKTKRALLNDSNPDRDSAYAKVLKDMDVKGQDFLTKDEFEAFADFRKKLEQFM